MDMPSGPSPHRPLSQSEIRLVKLYPGEFDDPVECVLEHVSLDSEPEFIALSYTWGDPEVTSEIWLDGQEYHVTMNLKSFLQHTQALLRHILGLVQDEHDFVPANYQSVLQLWLSVCPNYLPQDSESDASSTGSDSLNSSDENEADRGESFRSEGLDNDSKPDVKRIGVYLWIDALCINQRDIPERNRQVSQMRDIYATASCLFIWLGDYSQIPEPDVDIAFDFLIQTAKRMDDEVSEFNLEERIDNCVRNSAKTEAEFLKELDFMMPDEIARRLEALRAIATIATLPWFTRVWIVQEVVLSRASITVWCGFHHIPWIALSVLITFCCKRLLPAYGGPREKITAYSGQTDTPSILIFITEWHQELRKQELPPHDSRGDSIGTRWLKLLNLAGNNFKATDPRDTIYGLLGLLGPGELPPEMQPDYGLPVSEVFHRCAVYLLKQSTGGLDFLLSSEEGLPNMPTWVPDWTAFPKGWEQDLRSLAVLNVSEDGNYLTIEGVLLGRVKSTVTGHISMSDEEKYGILSDLTPSLGIQLNQLENDTWQRLTNIQPNLSAAEFRARWVSLWRMHDEETLHFYDVLVGKEQPFPEDLEKGLLDSSVYLTVYEAMLLDIMILEGGHLGTNRRREPIMENDLAVMIKGVGKPCIIRQDGSRYRFCGMLYGSSYNDNPDEEFYESNTVDKFVLI